MDKRLGQVNWGKGNPRRRTSPLNWREPLKWNRRAAARLIRGKVFCLSLGDWLDPEVPVEWLEDLLTLIHRTQHLDWLLLTKRPELWRFRLESVLHQFRWDPLRVGNRIGEWLNGKPFRNIWIGVSVEDQRRADERLPKLLAIPALVRFLSCEPLLGHVHLGAAFPNFCGDVEPKMLSWVIVGGETGLKKRRFDLEWARELRDECADAGWAFFMKQVNKVQAIPSDLMIREFPS